MMKLSANLSEALIDLIQNDSITLDAVEIGPWYSIKQIRQFQARLPEWTFYFHPGNVIMQSSIIPGSVRQLKRYLQCTQSPWASCHISLLMPGYIRLALQFGWYLPPPNVIKASQRFIRQVTKLASKIDVPIILENMPTPPDKNKRFAFNSEPALINDIIEQTNCAMLLDLAHARIAAAMRGIDVYDYLIALPLHRVIQIHISGSRKINGYLQDTHEPLEEIDYAILEWILERTVPQMITLEYFKAREPLREQLLRLHQVINR